MRNSPIFAVSAVMLIGFSALSAPGQDDPPPELDVKLPRVDATDTKTLFKLTGQRAIVSGKVNRTKDWEGNRPGNGINFLNFENAQFVVVCFERNFKNFEKKPAFLYRGKHVEVVGVIKEYKGKPEIELVKPAQVIKTSDAGPDDGDQGASEQEKPRPPRPKTPEKVDPDAFFPR